MPDVAETENRQIFQQFPGGTAVVGYADYSTGQGKELFQALERLIRPVLLSAVTSYDIGQAGPSPENNNPGIIYPGGNQPLPQFTEQGRGTSETDNSGWSFSLMSS